jgi:hypothetical protein
MGWEIRNGRAYYYHKERFGARVVSRYVGKGPTALMVARREQAERDRRAWEAEAARRAIAESEAFEAELVEYCENVEQIAKLVLMAAGFHRPKRGPWRKRRVHRE